MGPHTRTDPEPRAGDGIAVVSRSRGGRVTTAALLAYPFLVHAMVATGAPHWRFASIATLGTLALAVTAPRLGTRVWVLAPGILALAAWFATASQPMSIFWVPPVLANLALAGFFGRTLLPGSTPLVTRIAASLRGGEVSPAIAGYTRRVTIAWVIVFVALALESALLAALAPVRTWSLVTNFANYAFVTALFSAEFVYHTWRYPNPRGGGFLALVRAIVRLDHRRILED